VLRCPAEIPDREIGEKLRFQGITYVSESTQHVFLNDFGEILELPLDRYRDRVEPFDPRDDGYAEKLRAFFIREGERYFFLEGRGGRTALEKKLLPALGSREEGRWVLDYPPSRFPWPALVSFAAAALVFVILACLHRPPGEAFAVLCAVPVLLPLALSGPQGLGPAGILASLFFITREALIEWFCGMGKHRGIFLRRKTGEILGEWLFLYRSAAAAVFFLLIPYGFLCFSGGIPLGLALVPAYGAALVLGRRAAAGGEIRAFYPLPLKPPPLKELPASAAGAFRLGGPAGVLSVFTLAQLLAFAAAEEPAPRPFAAFPGPEEYARHAAFQSGFSFRPLHRGGGVYGTYSTGSDGLITGFTEFIPPEPEIPPYPPFTGTEKDTPPEGRKIPPVFTALLALFFMVLQTPRARLPAGPQRRGGGPPGIAKRKKSCYKVNGP
jgi:hypothetical protein